VVSDGPFFRAFLVTVAVAVVLWHANPATVHAEDAATPRFKAIAFDYLRQVIVLAIRRVLLRDSLWRRDAPAATSR
jgi:hypothetical protein